MVPLLSMQPLVNSQREKDSTFLNGVSSQIRIEGTYLVAMIQVCLHKMYIPRIFLGMFVIQ